ncbi:chloride channel protein [Streptomyces spiralis]|uniref:chloride channel protein n=1 Tax=Streptomyces spiralis TaxID=66376 RepID=UPI0036A3E430
MNASQGWRLAEPLGIAPHSPLVPVAVGMAACPGSVAHAPLGVLMMVAEMLGDASLLGPGILAVLCAQAVTGRTTLYRSQLERVGAEPSLVKPAGPRRMPCLRRSTHGWLPCAGNRRMRTLW